MRWICSGCAVNQAITFGAAPTDVIVGTTFTPSATAPAGPVTLTVDPASAAVCSMSGGVVTTLTPGGCRIHADQPGVPALYQPAQTADLIVSVFPVVPTVNWPTPAAIDAGTPLSSAQLKHAPPIAIAPTRSARHVSGR